MASGYSFYCYLFAEEHSRILSAESWPQSPSDEHLIIGETRRSNMEDYLEMNHGVEVMHKMTLKEHFTLYWEFFFNREERIPASKLPLQKLQPSELLAGGSGGLKASWLGHSSLFINIDGYTVLTDPVFQRKITPVGPKGFHRQLPLHLDDVAAVDIVIISHDHYDHLNKYSILGLAAKTTVFVVPEKVGKWLVKWGIPQEKIVELAWWETFSFTPDLQITATPAQHFSGRGLWDRNTTLWASWVISSGHHRIFFSGDSGYFDGFSEIGQKFGPFDVTFLECGAYNEGWANIHMFPEETVKAYHDLKGKILQPVHWATFNLSLHPWYEPIERLMTASWQDGACLSMPVIGAVVDYNDRKNDSLWWLPLIEKSKVAKYGICPS